ncbi:peptidylprolyl isomerase [Candidatus Neomarinimicrobiota bacterium]
MIVDSLKQTCLFLLLIVFSLGFSQEQKPTIEGIAAIVGDNIILKSELSQLVNMTAIQQEIRPDQNSERFLQLQEQLLQSIIDQKIVLEMAKLDTDVVVKEKDVNNALDMQIEKIITQTGSEERAELALGQSLLEFRRDFWYDIRDRLITEQFQQSLLTQISVNRNEVVEFYNTFRDSLPLFPTQIKLRHLLVTISPNDQEKQKTRALLDSLRLEIINGASFETLAATYSQDPGSRNSGGALGLVKRGSLVSAFEETAFLLEPGEVSNVVETTFGYHIIQTTAKQGEKIQVRHILIKPEVTDKDESESYRFASTLRDSATTLDKFIGLISNHSSDERTKNIGGELGWINPDNYHIAEIGQVVGLLNINECSPPVKTEYGLHLLWIEDVKPGGVPEVDKHWNDIEAMALNKKKMDWYQEWIENARQQFYVDVKTD